MLVHCLDDLTQNFLGMFLIPKRKSYKNFEILDGLFHMVFHNTYVVLEKFHPSTSC